MSEDDYDQDPYMGELGAFLNGRKTMTPDEVAELTKSHAALIVDEEGVIIASVPKELNRSVSAFIVRSLSWALMTNSPLLEALLQEAEDKIYRDHKRKGETLQ